MPRPRIYATDADRQRAHRNRHRNDIPLRNVGRPRIWADDRTRMHAHWMRHLARMYRWSGFWAEDAKRVDQKAVTA